MDEETAIIEEELVYGALRRERLWQRLGLLGLIFGILGCLSAAAVAVLDVDPPPVVVPYDPATGFALPEASVGATTVTENRAIIKAEVFRYVTDREVYNQLDNDLRIRSVLRRSDGAGAGFTTPDLEFCESQLSTDGLRAELQARRRNP